MYVIGVDSHKAHSHAVHLAHPLKVRAIAEARIKTDRIDSQIPAPLLRCHLLPTAYVRPRAEERTAQHVGPGG